METPGLTLPPEQESLATIQDVLMQLRRRDRERAEEMHALAEQLGRIERELIRLSAFAQHNNRDVGLRSSGEQVVNLDRLAGSEPPGEDMTIWPTHPAGAGTDAVESVNRMLTVSPPVPTLESCSRPTPPPNMPTLAFISASPSRRTGSSSIQDDLLSPSFLSVPDDSPPILAQVTNTQLMVSLSDLRRTMDSFIRRQQITNDMLEDLRGRIPALQRERLGVSGLTNYTEDSNHMLQSMRTVPNHLGTSSGKELVEASAPSRSPIVLDVHTEVTVSQTTPQESSSPMPEPPSIHLTRIPSLTSLSGASSAGYPHAHTLDESSQPLSIWQPRARRVVPRRRVLSEPASSASQKTGSHRESRARERERAPGDNGAKNIASCGPSILRSQSPDRMPLNGAQYEKPDEPNALTSARPMVCCIQLRVSPPEMSKRHSVSAFSIRTNCP